MSKPDDSGPAFPNPGTSATGMTIRDYFAGQVLLGISSAERADGQKCSFLAETAYTMADAMIQARSGHGRPSGEA